jgi:hypothetical protein
MSKESWTFVSTTTVSESAWIPSWTWCREQLDFSTWDHTYDGFWFKHEKDAIIFTLKWL